MASPYAKRFAVLAGRIFGYYGKPIDERSKRILRLTSSLPRAKRLYKYYAPLEEYENILYELRNIGLYRNEQVDFQEEMKRLRELRGKVKPKKGEGRKALMK